MTEPPIHLEIDSPTRDTAPRFRRSGLNVRMLRLVGVFGVVAALAFVVWALLGTGGSEEPASGADGSVAVDQGGEIAVAVGESFWAGDMEIVVTGLMPVREPTRPRSPMAQSTPRSLRAGEAYYQAFVRAANQGGEPLRVDPQDFALEVEGISIGPEPALSGPAGRSLLPGASYDLILTFIVPEGSEAPLVYRAESGGVVRVEGVRAPEAFESVTTTFLHEWPVFHSSTGTAGAAA